jgi:hypothetical protein
MPQFKGSPEEWHQFATDIATEPAGLEGGYGVRPHDPSTSPAPVPEPTPVPVGVTVVHVKRDAFGAVVEKTTIEGPERASSNFGPLLVIVAVVAFTWVLHRLLRPLLQRSP